MLGDRRSLAFRLHEELFGMLQSGELGPGDRVPTEGQLSERYQVGRTTVREALKVLEKEGLIESRQGAGRFVTAKPVLQRPLTRLEGVSEMVQAQSQQLVNQVLSLGQGAADREEAEGLKIKVGSPVIRLERLRLQKEKRQQKLLVYSLDVMPQEVLSEPPETLDFSGSLFALLESRGHTLKFAVAQVQAVQLPRPLAERLGRDPAEPWLLLTQQHVDPDGRHILYSKDYHLGANSSFHLLRTRE